MIYKYKHIFIVNLMLCVFTCNAQNNITINLFGNTYNAPEYGIFSSPDSSCFGILEDIDKDIFIKIIKKNSVKEFKIIFDIRQASFVYLSGFGNLCIYRVLKFEPGAHIYAYEFYNEDGLIARRDTINTHYFRAGNLSNELHYMYYSERIYNQMDNTIGNYILVIFDKQFNIFKSMEIDSDKDGVLLDPYIQNDVICFPVQKKRKWKKNKSYIADTLKIELE